MTGASPTELLQTLRQFGLENDRLDAQVARIVGASPAEFKAMDHLHAAGELTPGQLADRLSLTSGAVTALLDRLERQGWVERGPHPSDRRSIVVRPAGGEDAEAPQIYAKLADDLRRLATKLSAEEREALAGFLRAAGEVVSRRTDELRS